MPIAGPRFRSASVQSQRSARLPRRIDEILIQENIYNNVNSYVLYFYKLYSLFYIYVCIYIHTYTVFNSSQGS